MTKDVTSWNHSCGLNKGLSEKAVSMVHTEPKAGRGGQWSSRHRCVGAGASQLCPPSPTSGGLLITHQHLLLEVLCEESRGANLKVE